MGTLLEKIQSAYTDRERGLEEQVRSQFGDGELSKKIADASVADMLEARAAQREYVKNAPKEMVESTKRVLENLGSRRDVLAAIRSMTPEQRDEVLRLAPGVAQEMGDERGGAVARTLGAIGRGLSHGVAQPVMELTGIGGTDEEIEYIRQLDAASSQEMHPYRPGDAWYERGPLQAVEMVPWMATTIGGGGLGRAAATGIGSRIAARGAAGGKIANAVTKTGQAIGNLPTKVPVVGKYMPGVTAGAVGEVGGITAAGFPSMYAQELDSLRAAGVQDNPQMRMIAAGTALIASMVEGVVPNPFVGKIPLSEGAAKAARKYLWETAKRAPGELSEEYLQGVVSGLGEVIATNLDEQAPDTGVGEAFTKGWEQAKEAALPLAFLMGVPAAVGAGASAAKAGRAGKAALPQGEDPSMQAERDKVMRERERLAREQQSQPVQQPEQTPGVPANTTPPAGETTNVPPASQREGVIQDGQNVQQGNVQGDQEGLRDQGGQGQVGTAPASPVGEAGASDTVSQNPAAQPAPGAEGGRTSPPSAPGQDGSQKPGTLLPRPQFREGLIGKNSQGEPVYERPNGQRYVLSEGVEIEEKVTLRPRRRLDGGIEYAGEVDTENRDPRFVPEAADGKTQVKSTDTLSVNQDSPEVDEEGFARFEPESGTLGIPRAEMPQVTSEQRGALANFARARGVEYERTSVLPTDLKPSQAEYSPEKVQKAREFEGPERAILVSNDGYVVDGHHQWKRNLEDRPGEPMEVIRLGADAKTAIDLVRDFPSSQTSDETGGGPRKLGQPESASGNVSTPASDAVSSTKPAPEFEANRDAAVARVKKEWGQTVVPREPKNEDEQEQIDFLKSRGKQASFVDGDQTFTGVLDERSGFMLLTGDREANDIWRTIGHELAHGTGLDKIIPVDSAELEEGKKNRLARAQGSYKKRLESDPALLEREARADIVGSFMRDKAFRDKLSRENPTLWEKLREAVLKIVGKWTPRNEAQALVLEELRKQPARKLGQPESAGGNVSTSQPASDAVPPESTAEIPQLEDAEIDAFMEGLFDEELGTQEQEAEPEPSPEPAAPPRRLGQPDPASGQRPTDWSVSGQAKPIPGMESEEATYTVHRRKPDLIPDTFSVVVAGKPNGTGWTTVKGTGMTPEAAYEDAVRMFKDKRKSQSPTDKPKTKIEDARDAVRKKKEDLYKRWNDEAKGKLSAGLDPSLAKLAFDIAVAEIQDGTLTFAAFVENVASNVSAELLEKAKPYFESAWRVAHKRGMTEEPAGKFDDVLNTREKVGDTMSPPRKIGDTDYGTVDKPNRVSLGEHFAEQLREGKAYPRITDARKEAADLIGGMPKDGTRAIKDIDESVEIGVVTVAREIAQSGEPDAIIYDQLVDLYSRQPNLGTRTSTSMIEQAYSTPAPLSFLVSRQAGITQADTVYDSSAGNGMLLIVGGERFANELNPERAAALRAQGIETSNEDATEFTLGKPITALAINPPFGEVKNEDGTIKQWNINGVRTDKVDHAITLNSLAEIPDNGKVAIIIGAKGFEQRKPKENRERGRSYLNGKGFYDAVYDNYNVVDHYTVHGDLYSRQGAAFPVDVIIIEGRGASSRPKPYNIIGGGIPQVYESWQELKDAKLLGDQRQVDGAVESRPEVDDQGGVSPQTGRDDESRPAGQREGAAGTGNQTPTDGRRLGDNQAVGRPDETPSVPEQDQTTLGTEAGSPDQSGRGEQRPASDASRNDRQRTGGAKGADAGRDGLTKQGEEIVADQESEVKGDQYQTGYTPGSKTKSVDALIPNNHQSAVQAALDAVADRYGDIDEFVARELGLNTDQLYDGRFSAEQVDALALGIARHKEGRAFILGDQTGVGKGRVAAGMMIYAKRQGFAPIFMTEKPTLYADMIRDLQDIGFSSEESPFKPLMTNATPDKKSQITLPDGRILKQSDGAAKKRIVEAVDNFVAGNGLSATTRKATKTKPAEMEEYDAIFTTYDQMGTVHGNLQARHLALQKIAPDAFFILDESHNAGGSADADNDRQQSDDSDDPRIPISQMIRDLISAETAGVYFSSATFAKRTSVMDLYAKTGMTAATNDNGTLLARAIAEGGVPLQQVVSQQLVESGAYLRRERSFDGVEFNPVVYDVPTDGAEQASAIFRAINRFDRIKQNLVAEEIEDGITSAGGSVRPDWATGDAGLTSTSFSSILWNLTDQMLLAVKADSIADEAIESLKRGESPVIYVDSTMEAALNAYIESSGVQAGDETDFSFKDLLQRYLDRSREVLVQRDVEDPNSYEQVRLTDEQLGEAGLAAFEAAQELIDNFDAKMPASPIDWIRKRIEDAGYSFGEYTGRQNVMRYQSDEVATLEKRPDEEMGASSRIELVRKFNAGEIDVLLFNSSGSTGISMHASEKFKNQRPRHMIIGQPSKNIDTFMQALGRVHRTGQVKLPRFTLAMTSLPAEIRLASILVKKLSSLNANVTASDKGSVSFDIPDVMNQIGDRIVAEYLVENDELNRALNEGKDGGLVSVSSAGTPRIDKDIARKASGRMAIMPLETQQEFWDSVTEEFADVIEELDRMGANPLSAQVSELDARTVESFPIFDGDPDSDNAFQKPAYIEKVIAKRPGKPMTPEEVSAKVLGFYELPDAAGEQEIVDASLAWQRKILNEVRAAVSERQQAIRDKGAAQGDEPDKISERVAREQRIYEQFAELIRSYAPGTSLSLWEGGAAELLDVIPGVVLSVQKKGKGGHPASLSKWRVEIAMGSPDRVLRLSLSRVLASMSVDSNSNDSGDDGQQGREGFQIFTNRRMIDDDILKDFSASEVSTVETRYIGTGNILAAFSTFREQKGRVTFFRDSEGNLRRGVLLPRSFNVQRWAEKLPVALDDINHIRQFLAAGNYLETPDKALNVMMIRGDLVIRAPKSRSRGGKYTLNPTILQAASPQEFVSIGARMEMFISDPAQQDAVLEAIVSVASLQATSEKELARRIKNGNDNDDRPDVIRAFAAPAGVSPTATTRKLGGGGTPSPAQPASSAPSSTASPDDAPIRQADIVTTWSRLFDVPIRIGGYKDKRGRGKVALGIYNHLTEIVRMREGNAFNIIVASHEIGHHIDKKLNLYSGDKKTSKLTQLKKDDPARHSKVRAQLQALDYDYPRSMRIDEGIAEAVRQIITGTAVNARLAPDAVAWVEEQIMADPKFGPAMKQAIEQAKRYQDQGAINRARMVFGGPPVEMDKNERARKSIKAGINRAYTELIDRLDVVRRFSEDVAEAKELEPGEASIYEEATAFQGTLHAHADRAIMEGVHSLITNELLSEPVANALKLLKKGESTNDADMYAVARLTMALPESYNSGLSREDAEAVIEWVESDPDRAQRWQKYHSLFTEHHNALIEMMIETGRISVEEGEKILGPPEMRALYVPLFREQTEQDKGGRRLGAGSQVLEIPKGVQRRSKSGSGRPVMPLMQSTALKTMGLYSVAQRQLLHNRMVGQTAKREGLGKWIDKIPPGVKVDIGTVDGILSQLVAGGFIEDYRAFAFRQAQKVREGGTLTESAIKQLADMYEIEDSGDADALEQEVLDRLEEEPDINDVVMMYSPDYRRPNGKYVIKVMRDGKPSLYEVDPELYEAFQGLAPETHTFITKGLEYFTRTFKAGAVGYNTAFLPANALADAGTFAINSQYVKGMRRFTKPWQWAVTYAYSIARGNPNELVSLYRRHHGELYNFYGADAKNISKTMRRLSGKTVGQRLAEGKKLKGKALEAAIIVADGIEYFADWLRTAVAVSDVGPRLAEAEGFLKLHGFEIRDGRFYNTASNAFGEPSRDLVIKAMFAAGDVTYNYRRRGSAINGLERVFPFTNAALQSMDKTVRTYRRMASNMTDSDADKRKLGNQAFLSLMTLNSIYFIAKALQLDDDEELDDWEQAGYVTIHIPGTKERISLRQSREHSWIANGAAAAMRYFLQDNKDALNDYIAEEMKNHFPAPGGGGPVGVVVEELANYSLFRDRSIVPEYMRQGASAVSAEYQYDEYTLELSKLLGKATGWSPMRIDHILSGLTGGAYNRLASTGEKVAVPMLQAMGTAKDADVRSMSVRDIPFLRGVYRDSTPRRSVNEFYERLSEIQVAINDAVKAGAPPDAELIKQKQQFEIAATMMKVLSDSSGPEYDSTENRVAIARMALGRSDHPNYPNPLYTDLPREAANGVRKLVFNDLDRLARDLGRPSKSEKQTDDEYAETIRVWEARREGEREFWQRHVDSPIVKDVLAEVKTGKAFRELLRGEGKPARRLGEKPLSQYREEVGRFVEQRDAAREFQRFGQQVE